MRFYTQTHAFYCGIDLHARWMYLCVLDQQGEVLLHRNLRACPEAFLKAIQPYRQDLVVAVECHLQLVLAGRSVRPARYRIRLRSCPLHESYSRRQSQK